MLILHCFYFYETCGSYANPALLLFSGLFHHKNIPYICIDGKLDKLTFDDIYRKIKSLSGKETPVFFGVSSANTTTIHEDLDFVRFIKNYYPDVPIIMGGPHVSVLPELTLSECKELDYVCKNDGTNLVIELYDYFTKQERIKEIKDIKGIAFRNDDGEVEINNRPLKEKKLWDYGRPRWEDFSSGEMYYVFTALGCPFTCSYCYNATGGNYIVKPVKIIIEELLTLIKIYNMSEFRFCDGTFGVIRNHTISLLNEIINEGINRNVKWSCSCRVDIQDEEMMCLMAKAGCYRIYLGVESGSNRVLKLAGKNTSIEQIERIVGIIKKYGIECYSYAIFGHIGETHEDMKSTSRLLVRLNPDFVGIGIMTPWPGTKIYELARKRQQGFELATDDFNRYDKYFGNALVNNNVSLKEMEKLRLRTYILLYVYNNRYYDFFLYLWDFRKPIFRKLTRLLFDR
jgi:radical SAM superfamily enzyme YgiQ (UPF0313 family)